jgi:hypothetical protein
MGTSNQELRVANGFCIYVIHTKHSKVITAKSDERRVKKAHERAIPCLWAEPARPQISSVDRVTVNFLIHIVSCVALDARASHGIRNLTVCANIAACFSMWAGVGLRCPTKSLVEFRNDQLPKHFQFDFLTF